MIDRAETRIRSAQRHLEIARVALWLVVVALIVAAAAFAVLGT